MHACYFCQTEFLLDPETIAIGYFARGRCPNCGSVNVIVPGVAMPTAAPLPVEAAVEEASPIELGDEAVVIAEGMEGASEAFEVDDSDAVDTSPVEMEAGPETDEVPVHVDDLSGDYEAQDESGPDTMPVEVEVDAAGMDAAGVDVPDFEEEPVDVEMGAIEGEEPLDEPLEAGADAGDDAGGAGQDAGQDVGHDGGMIGDDTFAAAPTEGEGELEAERAVGVEVDMAAGVEIDMDAEVEKPEDAS